MKYTQKKVLRWMVAMGLTMTAFSWGSVEAMPTGGEVRSGDAEIKTSGQTMDIDQKTSRVALDWTGFDIAKGETVRFHQNPSDIAINRILGNKASEIYGNLQAGGTVFLLNPQGILFGQGAQVDVGNLIASTAQVDDSFMKGFSADGDVSLNLGEASKGKVINAGDIKAQGGLVALHAANVENTGSIKNDGGKVSLAAVKNLELAIDTAGKINFETNGETANAHTLNAGTIQADGGYVVMTAKSAGDMLSEVVNNTGIIEAKTASINDKGEILLDGGDHGTVNVSGKLDASGLAEGQSGGTVRILGKNTNVQDGAKLTASGDNDGGLVETSGDVLDVSTKADIEAKGRTGKAGEWLLDPIDVIITDSKPNGVNYKTIQGNKENKFNGANNKVYSYINVESVNALLNSGTSVTIQAIDNREKKKDSNIIVNSAIKKESGKDATLSLEAERNIYVNAEIISTSNKLNVWLQADKDGDSKGAVAISKNINTNGGIFNSGSGKTVVIGNKNAMEGTVGTYLGPYDVDKKVPTNDDGKSHSVHLMTGGGDVNLYGDVALGLNEGELEINTKSTSGANGAVYIKGNIDSMNTYKVFANVPKKLTANTPEEKEEIIRGYYDRHLKDIAFLTYDKFVEKANNKVGNYEKLYNEMVERCFSQYGGDKKTAVPKEGTQAWKDALKLYFNAYVSLGTSNNIVEFDDLLKPEYQSQYNKLIQHLFDITDYNGKSRESILKRWENAEDAAREDMMDVNKTGAKYLATITSPLEDWIVSSRLAGVDDCQLLIGGKANFVTTPENKYNNPEITRGRYFKWETGPEKGTLFYTATGAGVGYVAKDMYQGWSHEGGKINEPNNQSIYEQPYVAIGWRNDTSWSDVVNLQTNIKGFIQETNSKPSTLKVDSGTADVIIGGNIGKSARLHELDINTSGNIKIGGGPNPAAKNNIADSDPDLHDYSVYRNRNDIKADIVKLGVEESYRYNNSVERPQFAPLSFTPITGEAGYREVQDEKISSVEQVLGLTTAKLPLVKEVNGKLSSYGTYQLAVAPDKVTMELVDTSVPIPANVIHDQYREYTKNLTTKRDAADFKLSYDGSVFALHPIGQEAEKMLEAGDAAHNVDVVSQALYTAFHDMGLTLDDLDAVYVCFA
ncbi:MAG: filamentous hemagglutinin N-terminal domain-containing protein [Selenomonas ruminantium]|jgi:filamentous hemagglutinin family protein|uniref:Filamentous hemagglutinin N-terminal domain-containing protein n=1 Tax=Selenomonas ruminantium TaxID=971 RepID=A0A927ZYX3_SELRU|nr:filamentous hemagglutinin N-terminal domain-containing protein [Selenomonas ruminantium]MBE6085003.1 filamentous hemagglutinin N-terminal domain-containing protein [Selenomonas ruminantium]